ncbi:MAG: hypothetical protein ABH852_04870 [Methanobacteriota archaeon]
MSSDLDIYGKGNELERLAQRIRGLRIDAASKVEMLEFKRFLSVSGLGRFRVCKYAYLSPPSMYTANRPHDFAFIPSSIEVRRHIEEVEMVCAILGHATNTI